MADGGVSLSLDDYIKVKKKEGSFKTGKVGAKFSTMRQRQRGGRVGRGRNVKQGRSRGAQGARVQNQMQQSPRRNRQQGRGQGRIRFKSNIPNSIQNKGRSLNQRFRGGGRGGMRLNNRLRGVGQIRPLMYIQGGSRNWNIRNIGGGGGGISQHLSRGRRQRGNLQLRTRSRIQQRGGGGGSLAVDAAGNIIRTKANNIKGRVVMKFAQKRVQRARLQLNQQRGGRAVYRIRQGMVRRVVNPRPLMPLLSNAGVRRSRQGFVTVRDPLERQIQQIVIQEKIQKARAIRENRNRNFNPMPQQRYQTQQQQLPQFQASPHPHPAAILREGTRFQTQFQSRGGRQGGHRGEGQTRKSLNQFDRSGSIPMIGSSMYADQEISAPPQRSNYSNSNLNLNYAAGVSHTHTGFGSRGRGWTHGHGPIVRTTVNNMYDPSLSRPSTSSTVPMRHYEEFGMSDGLNPDIQRKINFIQSRGGGGERQMQEIIPDFRAPIVSSNMKLGDRFKMYRRV